MKTAGIIAEFNPFHNGHKYLFDSVRNAGSCDCIVVVMSGAFVQRGEPACMHKYDRVRAALKCGADMVLELPVSYATATAGAFAYGGVSILDALGGVDILAFGAEDARIDTLRDIARRFLDQSDETGAEINDALKQGLTYPAARAKAYPEYADILSKPNNTLAVEYIKSLLLMDSNISPYAIMRQGTGYNSTELSEYASASAIRNALGSCGDDQADMITDLCMPGEAATVFREALGKTCPVDIDDLGPYADHTLLVSTGEYLSGIQDINRDLANRFINTYTKLLTTPDSDRSVSGYIKMMRTKEITYSRLGRGLLHAVMGLEDLITDAEGNIRRCPYTRILGFRSDSSEMVGYLTHQSGIPVITKPADARKLLNNDAYRLFEASIRADRLYDTILYGKFGTRLADSCQCGPLIL